MISASRCSDFIISSYLGWSDFYPSLITTRSFPTVAIPGVQRGVSPFVWGVLSLFPSFPLYILPCILRCCECINILHSTELSISARCRCCSCPFRWSRNLDLVVRCGFALRFLGLPSSNGPSLVEACIVGTRRLAVGQVRSKILVQFVMRGYLSDWQTCLEIFRRTLYLRFVHRLAGLIRSFHQNFSPSTGWQDPPGMVSAIFTHDLLAMFAVLGCPFLLMYSFPPSV